MPAVKQKYASVRKDPSIHCFAPHLEQNREFGKIPHPHERQTTVPSSCVSADGAAVFPAENALRDGWFQRLPLSGRCSRNDGTGRFTDERRTREGADAAAGASG